jgi:Ca2+-binding EF-hand superfamily protein
MSNRIGNKPQTFNRLFERMDRDSDGAVTKSEVKAHLKDAGVKAGPFGMVHSKASEAFIDNLDKNNSERVSWNEFKGVAKDLMPADIKNAEGRIDPQLADAAFTELDANKDGSVSKDELKTATLNQLPESQSYRSRIAEVAAKLGMDALDTDRDGAIERPEFDEAVQHASDLANMPDTPEDPTIDKPEEPVRAS